MRIFGRRQPQRTYRWSRWKNHLLNPFTGASTFRRHRFVKSPLGVIVTHYIQHSACPTEMEGGGTDVTAIDKERGLTNQDLLKMAADLGVEVEVEDY